MNRKPENHFNIPRRGNLATQLLILFVLLLVLPGVARANRYTDNGNDHKWSNPKNWDPEQVPVGSAEIIGSDQRVILDIPVSVGTLVLGGLGNTIDGPADSQSSLTVTSRLEITSGAIRNSGNNSGRMEITIPKSATVVFTGSGQKEIGDGVTVQNAGRIEWSGGPVLFTGLLNNDGVLALSGEGGGFGRATGNVTNLLNNNETGLIIKEIGAGTSRLLMTVNNKGVVAVTSGTLELGNGVPDNGASTGEYKIALGKKLRFVDAHTFNEPARFTAVANPLSGDVGPATVTFANTLKLSGRINTSTDIELGTGASGENGDIDARPGEASLAGSGRLIWKAGTIYGKFTFAEDFRTVLMGASDKVFGTDSVVTNRGTMDWFGPGIFRGGDSRDTFFNEGTFNLQAGGVFISNVGFSAPTFENRGTLNTFPNGTSEAASARIRNSGVVNIGGFGNAGILKIGNSGYEQTATGTLYMEVGGTNAVTPQFDQLLGGSITLGGTLNVDVINNFNPAKDARFTLINSQTGKFARVFSPGGPQRTTIEYPGNNQTDLVSLSDAPIPLRLWGAGRDLARNETPDRAAEAQAVNENVPQWSYGYRSTAGGTDLTLFTPEQHINDGSGLHGWIAPGQITLGVNTKSTPIVFNTGSGPYKPLLPDQIYMSPGPNNEFIVARWTAPAAGDYRITARWVDLDNHGGNGATAYFFKNGQETICDDPNESDCRGYVEAFEAKPKTLGRARLRARTLSLNAGDVLDFVLGSNGESSFDATGFNAAIRRIPKITKVTLSPPAENNTYTEGQEITVDVEVDHIAPIESIVIDDVLDVIGTSSEAPYHFVKVLEPGAHYLRATARDDRKAVGVSRPIKITVNKGGSASSSATAAAKVGTVRGAQAATAFTGTTYRCATAFGFWENRTTWSPEGVPTNDDMAIIPVGCEVLVNTDHVVHTLDLSGRISQVPGDQEQPGIYVNELATITGGEIHGIPGQKRFIFRSSGKLNITTLPAVFKDVELAIYRKFKLVGGGVVSERSSFINTGDVIVAAQPGTQKPVSAAFEVYRQDGGRLIGGTGSTLSAPLGATIAGGVVELPKLAPVISQDGASLVSPDGGSLVSPDGGSLVSPDGGSLIGNDGSSLTGPDGLPLIGMDGCSLIGNDGSSFGRKPGFSSGSAHPTLAAPNATAVAGPGEIVLAAGAVITGSGELRGNVVNQGAYIAPGNSAGGIVVNGNYTQEAGGTLVVEVGGTTFFDSMSYDLFQVAGTATLDGNLIIKTINGYTPAAGDSVSPLLYGSVSGNFASISSNAQVTFGATGMSTNITGPNPPAPKALNIATRMKVETGDNALIAGFIITGSQPKKVIIRGIGPSLPFAGVLADPTLNLDNGAVTNDNWRTNQEQEIIDTTIPPSNNLESAIVATLNPGQHTAILRGSGSSTGIGVVEVYDLDSGSPVQLANISSRGFVQSGDNVMIGGFIIAGTYPAKVIVRAIAPSLPFTGKLADPTLELVNSNGGRISNDNWRETQEAEIFLTTIPPTNDNEAAIVATLAPGNYTAIVRGTDNTTGIAVVEAYNLQ